MFKKKNKSEIPPVDQGSSYSSMQDPRAQLLGSRGGSISSQTSGYGQRSPAPSYRTVQPEQRPPPQRQQSSSSSQRLSRKPAPPEPYIPTRAEQNREELFRGARPPQPSFGRGDLDQPDRYGREGDQQAFDEDDEVEAIKQQIRFTKQESLASTRNAARTAREAVETGTNTLARLGDQSERIANAERAVDMTQAHNYRAEDDAKEIKALNRSIFRPKITFNKQAKRDAAEQRIVDRHEREREEREDVRRQVFESRERVGGAFRELSQQDERNMQRRQGPQAGRIEQRGRYAFEADEEDGEVEDEINQNLDEIGDLSKKLNLLAKAANGEVRAQNQKLGSLTDKVDSVDTQLYRNTQRLARIK